MDVLQVYRSEVSSPMQLAATYFVSLDVFRKFDRHRPRALPITNSRDDQLPIKLSERRRRFDPKTNGPASGGEAGPFRSKRGWGAEGACSVLTWNWGAAGSGTSLVTNL
jgi:hypothetical protein